MDDVAFISIRMRWGKIVIEVTGSVMDGRFFGWKLSGVLRCKFVMFAAHSAIFASGGWSLRLYFFNFDG